VKRKDNSFAMKPFNLFLVLIFATVSASKKRSKSVLHSNFECDEQFLKSKENSFKPGWYVVSVLPMTLGVQVSSQASFDPLYNIHGFFLKNGDVVNILEIKRVEDRVRGRFGGLPPVALEQGFSTGWTTLYHAKYPNSAIVKPHSEIELPWKNYRTRNYIANTDLMVSSSKDDDDSCVVKECRIMRGASVKIKEIQANFEKTKIRGKLTNLPEGSKALGHKEAWVTLYSATLPKDTFVSKPSNFNQSDTFLEFTDVFNNKQEAMNRVGMKLGNFGFSKNPFQKHKKKPILDRKSAYMVLEDENITESLMQTATPIRTPSNQKNGVRNRFIFAASSSILSTQKPSTRPSSVLPQKKHDNIAKDEQYLDLFSAHSK